MTEPPLGISVLIPVLNEAEGIAALLTALQQLDVAEIIVADGGSGDATRSIVAQFGGVLLVACPRGRGPGVNAAARAATQPLLVILHADTFLPTDAPRLIRATLADENVAAGCFRMSFNCRSVALGLYAWASRYETACTTFGDQAYFMRRATFEVVGGAPDWPFLEDVALREKLKACGRFVKRPESVVTSARRFEKRGIVRGQLRNAIVLGGYACGVPIAALAAYYQSDISTRCPRQSR
jgi:rSAM/selenodomain-associated transferase 2